MKKTKYLIFCFFLLIAISINAQNTDLEKAKLAIENNNFLEAYIYANQAKPTFSATQNYETQFQNTVDYLNIIEAISKAIQNPSGKQLFYQLEFEVYEEMLAICAVLYQKNDKEKYFEKAFELTERHRNLLIFNTLGFGLNVLSDSLKMVEGNYLSRITTIEDSLVFEKKRVPIDARSIDKLEIKRDDLQEKYQIFLKENTQNKSQNRSNDFLNIPQKVKENLKNDEAFITYFYGQKSIYAFIILPNKQYFFKLETHKSVAEISEMIVNIVKDLHSKNELKALQNLYELHEILIKPIASTLNQKKKLQIVADGALSALPFDALLRNFPKNWDYDYSKLLYLVYDFQIVYQHSATVFVNKREKNKSINKQIKNPKILFFAPNFNNEIEDGWTLKPLKKGTFLSERLQENWSGKYFETEKATLENFKQNAKNSDILHFATHTLVNEEMPLATKILFSKPSKPLQLKDLYEMNLTTNLAVLGSCKTGVGNYEVGVGRVGMSYGFQMAGVSSLVYSLWEVDETATNSLLLLFYDNLKNGLPKGEALHQAKIQYLKSANEITADPYYWSGFVLQGDTTAFQKTTHFNYWVLFVFIAIILVIFGLYGFFKM